MLAVVDVLSIFHEEAHIADARTLKAMMQHLKEVDTNKFTVIIVQVENEGGIFRDSRDGSLAANN